MTLTGRFVSVEVKEQPSAPNPHSLFQFHLSPVHITTLSSAESFMNPDRISDLHQSHSLRPDLPCDDQRKQGNLETYEEYHKA